DPRGSRLRAGGGRRVARLSTTPCWNRLSAPQRRDGGRGSQATGGARVSRRVATPPRRPPRRRGSRPTAWRLVRGRGRHGGGRRRAATGRAPRREGSRRSAGSEGSIPCCRGGCVQLRGDTPERVRALDERGGNSARGGALRPVRAGERRSG